MMAAAESKPCRDLYLLVAVQLFSSPSLSVHLLAQAVERSSSGTSDGQKITFNMIKSRLGDLMYKITAQKFEDPADGEEKVRM